MTILKTLTSLLLICCLIVVGGAVYFVSQFSAVYPPIEKYDYPESYPQFSQNLKTFSSANPEVTYSVTDTTGGRMNGYSYYLTVKTTHDSTYKEYNIAYKIEENWFGTKKNKIYLIGTFDRLKRLGGYKMKENGVKDLVSAFETDFMNPLLLNKHTSP